MMLIRVSFTRCGLTFRPVEADSGAIGGSGTHEFMAIAEAGEADIVYCTKCDYAANIEIGKAWHHETSRRSTARVIRCRYS